MNSINIKNAGFSKEKSASGFMKISDKKGVIETRNEKGIISCLLLRI